METRHAPWDQVIGELTVRDAAGSGGQVCLGESQLTSRQSFRICGDDRWYLLDSWGFATDGLRVCQIASTTPGCFPTPVEPQTWGKQKTRYRE